MQPDGDSSYFMGTDWPNNDVHFSNWPSSDEIQIIQSQFDVEISSAELSLTPEYFFKSSFGNWPTNTAIKSVPELYPGSLWAPTPYNSSGCHQLELSRCEVSRTADPDSPDSSVGRSTRCSSPSEASCSGGPQIPGRDLNALVCAACWKPFHRVFEIEEHAKRERHKPFSCRTCNKGFSRRDAWMRHQDLHKSSGQFPCPTCTKYQGVDAFRRRDHLRQHLRKFHRVQPNTEFPKFCRYDSCKLSSIYDNFSGFTLRKDYTKHMRESHGKETHDCYVTGCDRTRSRGFLRVNDLERHLRSVHANTTCVAPAVI